MIRPGVQTLPQRQTCHKVFHVFEGSGTTFVNGQAIAWSKGDFFVVPSLAWHHFQNDGTEPAVLFQLQDGPTQKRLGLWWEEVGNRGGEPAKGSAA
jgi:gentisate 1,2-dioxygenase